MTRTKTETYYGSVIIEGCFEVELSTIWADEKQRWKEKKTEDQGRETEDASAQKGRKVMIHCDSVFPMICGSRGSKSRLDKAAGAEPCGQVRDEKVHAVVALSTFASEKT